MDQYALGGSWLTEALNPSQYTYEVAPVFTVMEREIYAKMLGLIGFNDGEAIFIPGGSMGNMYAINVARYHKLPEVKTNGLYCLPKPLALFTSEKVRDNILKRHVYYVCSVLFCISALFKHIMHVLILRW